MNMNKQILRWLNNTKDFLSYFWILIFFFILSIFLLFNIIPVGGKGEYGVVLGIALGVLLGFLADISKRSFDQYVENKKMKDVAFNLLKQDAQSVFRSMNLYSGAIKAKNAPFDIKSVIPPEIDTRYWNKLSKDNVFLTLGAKKPFDDIFNDFWNLEKLNRLIFEAKTLENEEKRKPAHMLAVVIYRQNVEDKFHEKILKHFMTKEEITIFKESLKIQK